MYIKKGTYKLKQGRAIIEFDFENYTIYVFQGKLSLFDIVIKYRNYKAKRSKIRTPKHIHWVVDILMKMQKKNKLTQKYLTVIKKCWANCQPLTSNNYETLEQLIIQGMEEINIEEYKLLNKYGEYNIEFLYVLMVLLAVQEKTNNSNAYMFGTIIDELLIIEKDIFKIISTAGFNGRG